MSEYVWYTCHDLTAKWCLKSPAGKVAHSLSALLYFGCCIDPSDPSHLWRRDWHHDVPANLDQCWLSYHSWKGLLVTRSSRTKGLVQKLFEPNSTWFLPGGVLASGCAFWDTACTGWPTAVPRSKTPTYLKLLKYKIQLLLSSFLSFLAQTCYKNIPEIPALIARMCRA